MYIFGIDTQCFITIVLPHVNYMLTALIPRQLFNMPNRPLLLTNEPHNGMIG